MQETLTRSNRYLILFQDRVVELTKPRKSGMPNLFVLLWFPILIVATAGVLVTFGISGSSTTAWASYFGDQEGAAVLAGEPRPIRSDEWMIQSGWVVSQYQLGFPVMNGAFPGGVNALMYNDAPTRHWSMAFRPHLLGFLMLPLDQGMAVRWWLPVVALVGGCYVFLVLILPTRPLSAAALSIAAFFSPIIQWWMLPSTLWPVAWAFVVLAAVVLALRADRRWVRVAGATVAGYLTVTMAMSLYVPYMIATFVPVLFVSVGLVAFTVHGRSLGWRVVLARLTPLLVAGATAIFVVGLWLVEQRASVLQVLSTAYPGARNTLPGQGDRHDLLALMSAPFQSALIAGDYSGLGANVPESASALLVSLFLVPAMVWAVAHCRKVTGHLDWTLISVVVADLVILAFLYVPGWALLSKPLGLFLTTEHRLRLAFVVLNVVAVALLVHRLDTLKRRGPWWIATSAVLLVGLSVVVVALGLRRGHSTVTETSTVWIWVAVVLALAMAWVVRRRLLPAAVVLLLVSVALCGRVNPITLGVYDLRETEAGQAVQALSASDADARWVNVGGPEVMSVLFETGVAMYGGMQTYPPIQMWNEIDPASRYEYQWNRLAQVKWTFGAGEPIVTNPAPDAINVTFDACSEFAQSDVRFVLSDVPIESGCARTLQVVKQGAATLYIGEVIRREQR
ncbi:hypothetical protein [Pseudoclavibacter sp. CFCC 13611]|uniref:DUF7657 domain-containing protein n=1 Tax=Pseudoclavibacter sp. CFCC 13611 TaxID=2615178 RepID=UPI001301746B|nr:hypothetical protein [Pseudoclavibacter sp. CFCC 13611]KAB1663012.1 hypothetical protein F8O08_10750 [Pseudoclavibacter sp. CFCC 13611]